MRASIAIASPGLDQSRAIARILRASRGRNVQLRGVICPGETRTFVRGPFDSLERGTLEILDDVIPTGGAATELLLRRGSIKLGSVTMTASALRFYDKPWSLALATRAGAPVPATWKSEAEDLRFPVFYKSKAEGGGARGLARVGAELPQNPDLIYQEYIESPGTYGVAVIAEAGQIVVAHVHYERESYPELGGSAVLIERFSDERLLNHARAIIAESRFSGWGLVEFKYCPRREDYVFMELNAKFWASCKFAFCNEPLFSEMLFGCHSPWQPSARMVFVHRALARGWRYALTRLPSELRGAARDWGEGAAAIALARRVMPGSVARGLKSLIVR